MNSSLSASLLLSLGVLGGIAGPQTTEVGQQIVVAKYTSNLISIDGAVEGAEWSGAIPVRVDATKPESAPGLIPWLGQPNGLTPPRNAADLSYTIRALYDDQNLYVSVEVGDDIVIFDTPWAPYLDDDVEIFIDGDGQPGDFFADNLEGFQLVTSADPNTIRDVTAIQYPFFKPVDWSSQAGPTARGFVVEYRIGLDSINTLDSSTEIGFRRPQPGDAIGFNVTVADDDHGGASYLEDPLGSTYLAWDGSSPSWDYSNESHWGTLVFAP
jgi:hypothetical protein